MQIGVNSIKKMLSGICRIGVFYCRVNVVGTVALVDACWQRNIPCTVYATGCIYEVWKIS